MIRINLLPEAKRGAVATGGSSQMWGVIYLLSCFAWGVVLFLVYLNYNSVLEEQAAKNSELQGQIDRAKSQTENIGEVEAQLAKSKQLEEVVGGLQAARQGPARVLMELSKILSEGGGPTVVSEQLEALRRDNPLGAYNPGWDIRRLYIDSFQETQRKCTITGYGKSNEDVAEFLRRLNVSEVFDKVTLQSTTAATENTTGLPVVKFSLSCEVKY
jgi:type IV pilus assembly protein PilN